MDDAVELLFDRLVDLRDGVAGGDGGDAAEEVEVLLPRAVVDVLPLAAPQLDRLVVEEPDTREQALLVPAQQIVRIIRPLGLDVGRRVREGQSWRILSDGKTAKTACRGDVYSASPASAITLSPSMRPGTMPRPRCDRTPALTLSRRA